MPQTLTSDPERARQAADKLLTAYQTTGIFGQRYMPEDVLPTGVTLGSEAHLRFITLTVAIDYQRNADDLWHAARQTCADPETAYLFDPAAVDRTPRSQIIRDMQHYKLSRKHERDAGIWQSICTTLTVHFGGCVNTLLQAGHCDGVQLLNLIRSPHLRSGFPNLKGEKIGPLWIRMLHDNCHVQLARIADVPIPVDIHTAQASVQLGAVQTDGWHGPLKQLREAVQAAWREALAGHPGGAYPLRLDEPLWLLSRMGCRASRGGTLECAAGCPVAGLCDHRRPWVNIETGEVTDQQAASITFRT